MNIRNQGKSEAGFAHFLRDRTECLGGRDPSIGTETCVVVEQMESMVRN